MGKNKNIYALIGWGTLGSGLIGTAWATDGTLETFISNYKENNERTSVKMAGLVFNQTQNNGLFWSIHSIIDDISGASSPGTPSGVEVSGPSVSINNQGYPLIHFDDHRREYGASVGKTIGKHIPIFSFYYSKENDYISTGWQLSYTFKFNQNNSQINMSFGQSDDEIQSVGDESIYDKEMESWALNWTQVWNRKTQWQLGYSSTKLKGYLNDPYRLIATEIGTTFLMLPENRPEERNRELIFFGLKYALNDHQTLSAEYRLYWDDWGIDADTVELGWGINLHKWNLKLTLRFYDQTQADFYAIQNDQSVLDENFQPLFNYSSDYRLAAFSSVEYGIQLHYAITPHITAKIMVNYGQRKSDDIQYDLPNVSSESVPSMAEYNFTMASFSLLWTF